MEKLMLRNIKVLYAFRIIKTFLLIIPLIVPFFKEIGLNQTQIYMLQSVWAITILALEIPCGIFADKYGRKLSIVIGAILATLAYGLYPFANCFEIFVIANLIMGMSFSFISGADSAIAFDSFAQLKQEVKYLEFEGKSTSYSAFLQILAYAIGGLLAIISLKAPVIGQVFVTSCLIPISLLLTETPHLMKAGPSSLKKIFSITKKQFSEKKELTTYIILSTIVGNMTHTIVWITQPFYQSLGISFILIGFLWSLQSLAIAISAHSSESIEKKFGRKKSILTLISLAILCYFGIGLIPSLFTIPFVMIIYGTRGALKPIITNRINQLVDSKSRATIFSFESLIRKLLYALLGPCIGLIADNFSIFNAFIFSGLIYTLLLVTSLKSISKDI